MPIIPPETMSEPTRKEQHNAAIWILPAAIIGLLVCGVLVMMYGYLAREWLTMIGLLP